MRALLAFALLALAFALAASGCAKRESVRIDTGSTIPAAMVEPRFSNQRIGGRAFTPDVSYSVVNSAWLAGFWEDWKADLFDKGVTKWEGRFDCNKFAASFCAAAQLEFYRDKFHSWTAGQALAVGEVWYYAAGRGPHAIVAAITERGVVYIEPQTGKELRLTQAEESSIYFKRF